MKKYIKIIGILAIFILSIIIIKISFNNNYKNVKKGNNKSIQEIEEYILNIKNYKAKIDVTIKNNRNENTYKLTQEVTENCEIQKGIDPEEINGLEMTYKDNKLEIKNTKLNLSKIYENYPNLSQNYLFLTDFIKNYNSYNEKDIKQQDEDTILMEVKINYNRYNMTHKLYVNKEDLKPKKLEILDNNNNVKVYILYNEIEINI